jgi:hypothetical protein
MCIVSFYNLFPCIYHLKVKIAPTSKIFIVPEKNSTITDPRRPRLAKKNASLDLLYVPRRTALL